MSKVHAGDVMYANMNFPEFEYQEFPKWVFPAGGKDGDQVLCQNAEEEATVLGGSEVVREADEKARLIAEADEKNVQIDKRWSVEKLQKAIDDAAAA